MFWSKEEEALSSEALYFISNNIGVITYGSDAYVTTEKRIQCIKNYSKLEELIAKQTDRKIRKALDYWYRYYSDEIEKYKEQLAYREIKDKARSFFKSKIIK